MCPMFSKDHGPKTRMLTLEKLNKMLSHKWTDEKIIISIISGESLLNPEIFEILKYVKERFPNSEVMLLSNGTIPPKNPEIVKYIDNMGFSIDGGTKEIYEKIRTPAKFDHVIGTIKKWIEAKNKYNPKLLLNAYITLSVLNIEDFSNIVELVGGMAEAFGTHWNAICCQPVVIKGHQEQRLKEITLEHVAPIVGRETT